MHRLNWRPLLCVSGLTIALGCAAPPNPGRLAEIYNRAAQAPDTQRNPVIVIPGILGSHLRDAQTDELVWGGFTRDYANPQRPAGARAIALPMQPEKSLKQLTDNVRPDGVLSTLKLDVIGIPIALNAYRNILVALGVGGFRDQQLVEAGAVDYGEDHYTCFQFAYDWRRDNVENAQQLHDFIQDRKAYVRAMLNERYGVDRDDLKFDLVAHSMGGLIARYYLRYGVSDLPHEGQPEITWAGAEHVERVILVGTPNAGSAKALQQLVEGAHFAAFLPSYAPAILGTMPAIYQLLPRGRHHVLLDQHGAVIDDLYDPALWQEMGWGLAAHDQARVLEWLLPAINDPETRSAVALDHQAKALRRARQFHAALDQPAAPPPGLDIHLIAGDAIPTNAVLQAQANGRLAVVHYAAGDGTVTRASALADERLDRASWTPKLRGPVDWETVRFIFDDHLGITKNAEFIDNLLYLLLEDPR